MSDVTCAFQKSPSPNVQQYTVAWTYNGNPAAPTLIPQSAAGDATGYTADFAVANPAIVIGPGDTVGASIIANDTIHNLDSLPDVCTPVSAPITAPASPVGGVLTFVP